ncbi:phage tail assembly chaperone, partial [Xenorhabdus bovienii]|uniref:phage tail assembly chaperone n=1 Tax=Xenorhabdus bovienii TaxID=40576 RepID=UPI0023B22253
MAKTKKDLRALALAPGAGFRSKPVTVPEWGEVAVILREPSAGAWALWQEIISPAEGEEVQPLSVAEKTRRNVRGDVVLFIDVLWDEDGEPVFS